MPPNDEQIKIQANLELNTEKAKLEIDKLVAKLHKESQHFGGMQPPKGGKYISRAEALKQYEKEIKYLEKQYSLRQKELKQYKTKIRSGKESLALDIKALHNKLDILKNDKLHRNLLSQQYKLQHKIEYETAKIRRNSIGFTATMKEAVRNAFSWQKIMNRIAFVITAKLSYDLMLLAQRSTKQMVTNAVDFEKEMSKVFTLLEKNEGAFKKIMSDEVLNAMVNYGQELDKASRAVYDILSARFDPGDVNKILNESLKLSIGEFTDLKVATNAVTTVLNSFQMEANEAGYAASFLAQMVTDGKTTLEELEPNLGKMTSAAAALGFDMYQLGTAFDIVTIKGVKTDVAITSLTQLMMRLANPSAKASKLIEDLGIDLSIASIQAGGFTKVLSELAGLTEKQLLIFAKSKTGARALLALINSGSEFQEVYNKHIETTNAHMKKYVERMEDVSQKKKELDGLIKAVSIRLGTKLLPVLKKIISFTRDLVLGFYAIGKWINNNMGLVKTLTASIGLLTASILLMKMAIAGTIMTIAAPLGWIAVISGVLFGISKLGAGVTEFDDIVARSSENIDKVTEALSKYRKEVKEFTDEMLAVELVKIQKELSELRPEFKGGKSLLTGQKLEPSDPDKLQRESLEKRIKLLKQIIELRGTDAYKRNVIITAAETEYELAVITFKKSKQDLSALEEKKVALEKLIKDKTEILSLDDSIEGKERLTNALTDEEIELVKLKKKIKQEEYKIKKDEVAVANSLYQMEVLLKQDVIDEINNEINKTKELLSITDEMVDKNSLLVKIKQLEILRDNQALINAKKVEALQDVIYNTAVLTNDKLEESANAKIKAMQKVADLTEDETTKKSQILKILQFELSLMKEKDDLLIKEASEKTSYPEQLKTLEDLKVGTTSYYNMMMVMEKDKQKVLLYSAALKEFIEKIDKKIHDANLKSLKSEIELMRNRFKVGEISAKQLYEAEMKYAKDIVDNAKTANEETSARVRILEILKTRYDELSKQTEDMPSLADWLESQRKALEPFFKDFDGLLAKLRELEDETKKIEDAKLNWKKILGVPDFKTEADAIAYAEQQLANTVMGIQDAILQHQLDVIEKRKQAELDALAIRYDAYEDNLMKTVLTEEHKALALAAMKKKEEEEKKKIEDKAAKDLAKQKKKNAIAEVGISFAQGLIGIASSTLGMGPLGIPWWVLLTGILTATHAAQMEVIKNTTFASGGLPGDKVQKRPKGLIRGQGTGTSDDIVARISNKEFITKEKATRGNVPFLYYQQEQLAKGKNPLQVATEYVTKKITNFVMPDVTPKFAYATGGLPVGGSSINNYNMDTQRLENLMSEQTESIKEMNIRLLNIEESNELTAENTDKMRRKKMFG